jgi:hypothetical protein
MAAIEEQGQCLSIKKNTQVSWTAMDVDPKSGLVSGFKEHESAEKAINNRASYKYNTYLQFRIRTEAHFVDGSGACYAENRITLSGEENI